MDTEVKVLSRRNRKPKQPYVVLSKATFTYVHLGDMWESEVLVTNQQPIHNTDMCLPISPLTSSLLDRGHGYHERAKTFRQKLDVNEFTSGSAVLLVSWPQRHRCSTAIPVVIEFVRFQCSMVLLCIANDMEHLNPASVRRNVQDTPVIIMLPVGARF